MTRACFPHMQKRGGGAIVNQSSTAAYLYSGFYGLAKVGINGLTQQLAHELGGMNIRVNAIASGPIPTDYAWEMLNPTDKSSVGATQTDQIPAGRAGTIEELANLTMFLLSDACDYLTGQTVAMDGGQMLAGPGTFAGLNSLTDADWQQIKETSKAASAASKSQRSV